MRRFSNRQLTQGDSDLIGQFRCSTQGFHWEAEVERHVQSSLVSWATAPLAAADDPRALLLLDDVGAVAGVVAHEIRQHAFGGSSETAPHRHLHLVAVATRWRGESRRSGLRLGEVLVALALLDMRARLPECPFVTARVHVKNIASIRLLGHFGFTPLQQSPGTAPDYLDFAATL